MKSARKSFTFGFITLALIVSAKMLIAVSANISTPLSIPDQLTDLDQRISKLEKMGPLVVTDQDGKDIFRVGSDSEINGAQVINKKGSPVAMMAASQYGGYFQATDSANASKQVKIGFGDNFSAISFDETVEEDVNGEKISRHVSRLSLGKQAAGNFALHVTDTKVGLIAGIGESKAGSGAIVIGNSKGSLRASFSLGINNKGLIDIFNSNGNPVATFGEAIGNTGGSLALGDPNSTPLVKIGTNALRYGVVEALPRGIPYVSKSGLPGSYMLGCAGGPSCVP
jgi:hypothetical protein